jgi:3-oxoacyl-(acyl-carrier-protein) synthase
MNDQVVITGEGVVCAIGTDKEQVLEALRKKRSGIGTMRYLRSVHKELPVGEVPLSDDEMRQQLGVEQQSYLNRTTLMGMLAVRQALSDAHIDVRQVQEHPLRIVLISGTTVAGMDVTEHFFQDMQASDEHLACLRNHSAGSSTRLIADYFGIFQDYTTISTACSSAANALILGANMLKAGQCDMVVAGGAEALSVFHLNGFNSLMILDHERCRPFDDTRAGLNLGEGAAFVVLESLSSAQQRGAEIHGYLSGYGNACDAFHQTASSDNGEGAFLAMTQALQMAGLQPADIQYVNAHGTGTPNNDQSESVALRRVFGERMPMVSSTKSFTGHTTSASGSIETVICLLTLHHQFVPANLGWSQPMADGIVPTLGEEHCELQHVLCNSFGFGGNDSSLIVSRCQTDCLTAPFESFGGAIRIASRVEITSEEQLAEIRDYVKPLEARRMGKIMKSSLLSSLKALQEAGIAQPDAIITGTALGCLENSEKLLMQMVEEGEVMLKPTYFMQSTHNTIGSSIAIHLQCHGYNTTYSQDADSLRWALHDAELLLRSGRARNVLVGLHEETTPLYRQLQERLGHGTLPSVHSLAFVLSCGK